MADQQGWVLYYSAEGYPYYSNHATGESQWAQLGTTAEQYAEFHASAPKDGVRVDQHQQQYQQNYPQPRNLSHQEDGLFYPPQPPHGEEYIGEEEIDESGDDDDDEDDDDDDDDDNDDNDDEEEQRSSVENKRWRAFLVRRITCDIG